jgi:uncharacterized protein GlcG (DUF336 family)
MLANKPVLTLAAAKRIAASAEQHAAANGWRMVIAIADDGGHLLYLQRMDGALVASVEVATQKARCAALFRRATKVFEDGVAAGRNALLSLPGAVPVEGGIPLMSGDHVLGAIGVSGAAPAQDGQVAKAGVDELAVILASIIPAAS